MIDLDRRTWIVGLVVVALVFGVLPFLPILGWLPWGSDASKWIAWSSLDHGGWWESVTNRKHFVGYRPIAAFSYVLNHATTGHAPWGYRGLDLLLHGASGVLVATMVRQWTAPGRPLDWRTAGIAFVVVLTLFGHPATEEVVPFSARRSYLLSMCFGTGALVLFGEALRWQRPWTVGLGFVGAAGLLGLAVLSNESAYVLVPLLPMVGLHLTWESPRLQRIVLGLFPVVGVTITAIALRVAVLGSLSGGYYRRYFAVINPRGNPAWRELDTWQPLRILGATWSYLLAPHEVSGARLITIGAVQVVVAALGAAFVLALATAFAIRNRRDPAARSLLLALAWLAGSTAIIVMSQTWFWRQAYWLLPPYGLVLGVALAEAVARWEHHRRRAWALGGPAGALLLLALVHGPVLRLGMNTQAQRDTAYGSLVTRRLAAALADLSEPSDVALLVPLKGSRAHLARLWLPHLLPSAGHRYRLLGHLDRGLLVDEARPTAREEDGELVVGDGYWLTDHYRALSVTEPADAKPGSRPVQRLDLDELRAARRPVTVVSPEPAPLRIDLRPRPPATPPSE